ncbi:MAG: hypothetical protein AMJ92_07000 [candidate division Zixibacteria bacterium SM23_81]|nr:MAG: hypothetical protein AMJ92_07000 [candidate division Zixibacteria bacterium SM23_81]
MFKALTLILSLLFLMGAAIPSRSSEYGLTFNRDNRTYRWNNFIRYSSPEARRIHVRASGDLAKTLIKRASGSSGSDRWRDNYSLSSGFDYRLNAWSAIGMDLSGEQNEVNKGEIITRMGHITSFLTLDPRPGVHLEGTVGGKIDQKEQSNLDSKEEGLTYGFSGSWRSSLPKTQTTLKASLSGDKLSAGHSSVQQLMASVKRRLFGGSQITLSFDDQEQGRTNLFGPAEAAVLKRQDRINRSLTFKVELPLPRDHTFNLSLSSTDRRIEYSLPEGPDRQVAQQNSRKNVHRLSAQVVGRPAKRLTFSSDFALEEGKNDFGRDINDEDLDEISLSASVDAALSSRDSLVFSGHVARTSYDVPHPDNYNDRDSFRSALKIGYHHTFSAALQLIAEGTVNLTHLVYLRSQRSANNNWVRLYALYPTLHIRPWENLLIQQRFSISANYTEYDFEDLFTDIKSNIFRQAKTTTDLSYHLGEEINLNFSYTYRTEDFGRLVREGGWMEILSWDKSLQNIEFSVTYPLISRVIITPSLSYGHRREYQHSRGERNFKSRLISKRVGLTGRYKLPPNNDMIFSISRSRENVSGLPDRTFDRLQLSFQHAF